MNWHFAIEVAAGAGLLVGLAIWMLTGALYGAPGKSPRSDSEQQ